MATVMVKPSQSPGPGRSRAQDVDRHVGARMRERRIMLGLTRVPFVMGYVSSLLAGKDTKLADVLRQASGTATEPVVR